MWLLIKSLCLINCLDLDLTRLELSHSDLMHFSQVFHIRQLSSALLYHADVPPILAKAFILNLALYRSINKNIINLVLAGMAWWIECWSVNQRVADSIPSQGTCLGCRPGPQ